MNEYRLLLSGIVLCAAVGSAAEPIASIERRLPPTGIAVPAEIEAELTEGLRNLKKRLAEMESRGTTAADAAIYLKAVDYALIHREFYRESDFQLARETLQRAADRLDEVANGTRSWIRQRGLVVRGYYSRIDGSPQPYGLVIPDNYDFDSKSPLYVWLHGRGDKTTDMHFIHQRETLPDRIAPSNAIVLHPFGRHCVGFKHAGEIDVLDAINEVHREYQIDPNRIVLMGFSMGGAGAWHIGAHYTSRFVAVSPGAGFAETARYNRLQASDFPPWYEQRLWGWYDVPNYVGNLLNVPVVAYSGEIDKQIQAARVMEEAFATYDHVLPHEIGPGMGHKYHPASLKAIMSRMEEATAAAVQERHRPSRVTLQTQTLRYSRLHWIQLLQLEEHWRDTRVDGSVIDGRLELTTSNVRSLRLDHPPMPEDRTHWQVVVDGELVTETIPSIGYVDLRKTDQGWRVLHDWKEWFALLPGAAPIKRPRLQGPIDDAFLSPFLIVLPSGVAQHPAVERWVDFEQQHFQERWRALMRGEVRVKRDSEILPHDIAAYNLVLWGDPSSNVLLRRVLEQLPLTWDANEIKLGEHRFDASSHVPALIYPNPLNPRNYVVLNSGLTFREAHDRTNSLQNAKLPDWAMIDLSEDPNATAPGRIAAAGFFDEAWSVVEEN